MSNTVLKAENLKTYFPVMGGVIQRVTGHVRAVNGVSLDVNKGEIVSVVGESGCGKSTLGFSLLGLTKPTSGKLLLDNQVVNINKASSWKPFRRDFQIIFQDPNSSLNPRHTVYESLAEPLLKHGIYSRKTVKDGVAAILDKVGLEPDYMHRYPHAFSGGQRQRICIARVIGLKPKLIVCDEVTAALDVSVQAQIIELLMKLKEEMELSLIFISHDLSVVKAVSDRINVMYLGRIVESAPVEELFATPRHPYTRALLDAIPTLDRSRRPKLLKGEVPSPVNPPSGCVFHTRCEFVQDKCKIEKPAAVRKGNDQLECFFPLNGD